MKLVCRCQKLVSWVGLTCLAFHQLGDCHTSSFGLLSCSLSGAYCLNSTTMLLLCDYWLYMRNSFRRIGAVLSLVYYCGQLVTAAHSELSHYLRTDGCAFFVHALGMTRLIRLMNHSAGSFSMLRDDALSSTWFGTGTGSWRMDRLIL
jgi:hypothetical protein